MRILVLTTDAFGGHGGIAKYNRDLLSALCIHEAVTEVVALVRDAPQELEALPPKLTLATESLGGKGRFIAALGSRMAHGSEFGLVLCGHVNLLPLAVAAAWRYRARLVLWVYGIDAWNAPPSWMASKSCAAIDGFASISQITADRFRAWAPVGNKRQWLVPNAIELDRFTPGPKDPGLVSNYGLENKTVIATFGRLVAAQRMKGVDEVLEAMPKLISAHPSITYMVMGDGSGKSRLEQKARSLGVADHVVFTGRVAEREKVQHYRLADAYVMPSQGEGFGFVFLEALACGIPVVASRIDGGREAVRDGLLGTLVDPRDPADVVRAIEDALSKPRGTVPAGLEYFSSDRFTSRVHNFVDDVMEHI